MNIYREFISQLRILTFEEVHILVHDDISPRLKDYVFRLDNVEYTDGNYHYLYGNMKRTISSFVMFFSDTIDYVIKKTDEYAHVMTRKELIRLMERTIEIHKTSQVEFEKEYLPITTPLEKEIYNEIDKKYCSFMKEALEFIESLKRLDKQEKVYDFAKEHFKIALTQIHNALDFTHSYLARMLADRVDQIMVSLEEINLRLQNNLNKIKEDYDFKIEELHNELYDKNKDNLHLSRQYGRNSLEIAEVRKSLDILKERIENYEDLPITGRLEEEVAYWEKKVSEMKEVRDTIVKLKEARKEIIKQEEVYNSLSCSDLAETKKQSWNNIGENYAERKKYIDVKLHQSEKALLTAFCCRGNDRILYTDNVGQYYVDEYNHQVYVKDNMLEVLHINCDGDFVSAQEEAYYFDELGRYIVKDNEKIYRCAPCTSEYRLMENSLLTKITQDCGHSEMVNDKCRREIKDLTDVEILPTTEPVDIRQTLSPEVAKYLWDCFGWILPEALNDVGVAQHKNPIHHLAHTLLIHKYYCKTRRELRQKRLEAQKYRSDILKNRNEETLAANKAWKGKQVKPRKPEESDDTLERSAYDSHVAQQEFVKSLNFFN